MLRFATLADSLNHIGVQLWGCEMGQHIVLGAPLLLAKRWQKVDPISPPICDQCIVWEG